MDIFNRFEPGHSLIMNVMRFVIQNNQLVNIPDNLFQIDLGIGSSPCWFGPQKIGHRIFVLRRGDYLGTFIDTMNISEKNISSLSGCAKVVLNMKCQLKIIPPISSLMAIFRQHRVLEEYF